MYQSFITELCRAAREGAIAPTYHYKAQFRVRPTPSEQEILFMLCDDAPEVIEDFPHDSKGSYCLLRGINADGRIGHVACGYSRGYNIITAYFPAETEPEKWRDDDYRIRRS